MLLCLGDICPGDVQALGDPPELMLAELGRELVEVREIQILELLLDAAQLGGGNQLGDIDRAIRRLDQLGRQRYDLVIRQVVDLPVLGEQLDRLVEQESADAALAPVAEVDTPAFVLGMDDQAGGSGPENAAQGLTARLWPGHRIRNLALGLDHVLGEPPLLVLGGGQRPDQAPIVLQKIVAAVEPDQAAMGRPGDIAANLDDVVFQLADALGWSGTGPGSGGACGERGRREAGPTG